MNILLRCKVSLHFCDCDVIQLVTFTLLSGEKSAFQNTKSVSVISIHDRTC